jgi:hypothetical protein
VAIRVPLLGMAAFARVDFPTFSRPVCLQPSGAQVSSAEAMLAPYAADNLEQPGVLY